MVQTLELSQAWLCDLFTGPVSLLNHLLDEKPFLDIQPKFLQLSFMLLAQVLSLAMRMMRSVPAPPLHLVRMESGLKLFHQHLQYHLCESYSAP